jgi:hypothetical protein
MASTSARRCGGAFSMNFALRAYVYLLSERRLRKVMRLAQEP